MSEQVEGLKELLVVFAKLSGERVDQIIGRELRVEGELIMTDSKENYVPVDFGTLRSTGLVTGPQKEGTAMTVYLSYGGPAAPYALAVHENPRAGKTGGVSPSGKPYKHYSKVGQWKYLETPMQKAQSRLTERIGARLKSQIDSMAR